MNTPIRWSLARKAGLFAAAIASAAAFASPPVELVHARAWRAGGGASQSLFALGNGRMLAYLKGPDITHLFGPPLSSPNLAPIRLSGPEGLTAVSSRESGASVWHHKLTYGGGDAGEIVDFMDQELPCLVRRIDTRVPLTIEFPLPDWPAPWKVTVLDTSARRSNATSVLITRPVGAPIYGYRFRSNQPTCLQVVAEGTARVVAVDGKPGVVRVDVQPGRSTIYLVGGPELPECVAHTETALAAGAGAMLDRTRRWWRQELSQMKLPATPEARRIHLDAIAEDVAICLITQQAVEGGEVAGHRYPLAYVRDQFGVAQALLDLGFHARARRVLEFYWRIFQRAGVVHNAQTIGGWPYFHVHENDEVEMTGYLVIQALAYANTTGDRAFIREIFPMLDWACRVQERHLVKDMLPFNGDETYLPGGMVPRTSMDDGSAESTFLFFAGGERFADWAEGEGLWTPARAAEARTIYARVRAAFRGNFEQDGRIFANQPSRTDGLVRPRFRHGVCLVRQPGCEGFGWLEYQPDGRYACAHCFVLRSHQPVAPGRYYLPSVALTPDFLGLPLDRPEQVAAALDTALQEFRQEAGKLSYSRRRLPGYELGVLLTVMAAHRHPAAAQVADLLAGLRDDTGVWVEYYEGSEANGTRYRPWESAINLSGLLRHARNHEPVPAASATPEAAAGRLPSSAATLR